METKSYAPATPLPAALPADIFPGYQLLTELHRGGQGVVYRAIHRGTKRHVAIKVMKEGPFAGAADRARFDREVRILAQLKHPGIVAVHDTGEASGLFYFVMDYIRGGTLEKVILARALPLEALLELFVEICDAVNAAHLRGVTHRDLKPSNILVDQNNHPFILDFGLAKTAGPFAEAAPVFTVTGQFVGSIPWASPEQAAGESDRIDLRTDVYSLGVIFYQLLTGQFPYNVTGDVPGVLQRIMSTEPARPRSLSRQVDSDLETIVLKCLSKDRERRYQSAGELARDIRHYLAGEPIEARRDSTWYLFTKTMRRHRVKFGVAAGLVVLIGVSAVALAILYRQQTVQRLKAEQTVAFLQRLFSATDSRSGLPFPTTTRDMLDQADRLIPERLAHQPEVEAAVRSTIGRAYLNLSVYDRAQTQFEQAMRLREARLGPDDPELAQSLKDMADLNYYIQRFDLAEPLYARALDIRRRRLGAEDPDTLASLKDRADILDAQGRYTEAEPIYRQVLETRERTLGPDHPDTVTSIKDLGETLTFLDRLAEAEPYLERALDARRRLLGRDQPGVARSLDALAELKRRRGQLSQAESLLKESLEIDRPKLGPTHIQIPKSLTDLARVLLAEGQTAAAESATREAFDLISYSHPGHHLITEIHLLRAQCAGLQGRFIEAQNSFAESYDSISSGPDNAARRNAIARQAAEFFRAWNQVQRAAAWDAKISE